MLKKLLKKKEEPQPKKEITKQEIDDLTTNLIQKNLDYNAKMQDFRLKQGQQEIKEREKETKKLKKLSINT